MLPVATALPVLVATACHSWPDPRSISLRAFGNCSLGPAASVLPIVREACAKLLLVVNLLLPLLANLVGHADMQILLLLCVCCYRCLMLLVCYFLCEFSRSPSLSFCFPACLPHSAFDKLSVGLNDGV